MIEITPSAAHDMNWSESTATCDQIWVDARIEGLTFAQRREAHIAIEASGHIHGQLSSCVTITLHWCAIGRPGDMEIGPCTQNPDIIIHGPARITGRKHATNDMFVVGCLESLEVQRLVKESVTKKAEVIADSLRIKRRQ